MAGGGALQSSPAWARMMADAFNSPIHLLAEAEITARGVALMMRRSLDGIPPDADQPAIERVIEPTPERVQLLWEARARQHRPYIGASMVDRRPRQAYSA